MAAGENRVTPELNEKEVIELLEDLSNILGAILRKQLFHSRLLDMRWLSPTRHAIYHLITNARSWNNCQISFTHHCKIF